MRADADTIDPHTVEQLLAEGAMRLSQAAAHLPPSRGKRRSAATLWRWIVRGVGGIRLEAFCEPNGAWWTSVPALARFLAGMTARKAGRPVPETLCEERARQRGEAAQRRLEQALNGKG